MQHRSTEYRSGSWGLGGSAKDNARLAAVTVAVGLHPLVVLGVRAVLGVDGVAVQPNVALAFALVLPWPVQAGYAAGKLGCVQDEQFCSVTV